MFGGDTYRADAGFERTAIRSDAGFAADNLDPVGVFAEGGIVEDEVRAGLLDGPRSRPAPATIRTSPPGSRTSPTRSPCRSNVDPVAQRPSTCTGRAASSTGDHILFLSSGTTPNLRHQASGGGTVTITPSVGDRERYGLVDHRRDMATRTL